MAFLDAWVVDKTMFDLVSQGGGCACCGITHAMFQLEKFQQCSDWDTDDEDRELFSPWPTFIHEDVQTQRCVIRASLKQQMQTYHDFMEAHGDAFSAWFSKMTSSDISRHVPQEEILTYLSTHGDVHGPYGIVLRAVTEQIKQFQQTGYVDARSSAELQFERHLKYVKGAFTIATEWIESTKGEFLDCVQGLAGPRLFPFATRVVDNQEIDTKQAEQVVQSFRSDRRLVRLVLLRLFTDTLIRKFKRTQQQK